MFDRQRLWAGAFTAFAFLWGCTGAACGSTSSAPVVAPAPISDDGLPNPTLRLAIVTDLKGYLEPCGCTSRPLGGIDRLAGALATARGGGPTLFLSAGDLFFDGLAHSEDAKTQELWKAETLSEILAELRLDAAGLGRFDLDFGTEVLSQLAARSTFPIVLAGVSGVDGLRTDGIVKEVGGVRVGVFAVAELDDDGRPPVAGVQRQDARTTALATAASLRERGAEVVIALSRGSRRFARRLADGPIDFVIQGGIDEASAAPPAVVGGHGVVHAAHQGTGLLIVDLFRRGAGEWRDVGAWTRSVEAARLDEAIRALEERIASWERGRDADQGAIAEQRARLTEQRAERASLATRPPLDGNAFAARFVEIDREQPSDTAIKTRIDAYSRRINEHNRDALAHVVAPPVAEGAPTYVGVARCETCHSAAVTWWRTTPHGRAYATLQHVNKEYNLSCVGCHVTGYGQPGGATVTHNEGLVDVQCEQCHGPGSLHAEAPMQNPIARRRDVPELVCVQCHNPEHSDRFHYPTYVRMLQAPGHGSPHASLGGRDERTRLAETWLD